MLLTDERLRLGDDLAHLGLDPCQVVVAEVGTAGELEVVVEAVSDGRSDGIARSGPEPEHGLGHDVGGRVPQDVAPLVGLSRDDPHPGAVGQRLGQVDEGPVHLRCDRRRRQAPPDLRGEIGGRRAGGDAA